ncbi:MAG: DUF2170 family protein [Mariprofundaceae bacterium]|nr:DUF2170 family protein [Mariprofundaceae bacterium]
MTSHTLDSLKQALNGAESDDNLLTSASFLEGLLQVTVEDRDEFPAYISIDEDQILCTTYLWAESEVQPDKKSELLEAMLTMNVPMPLSSFGKVGHQYLIFGAMSIHSSIDDIIHEVSVLSDNTLNAVEAMQDYLK